MSNPKPSIVHSSIRAGHVRAFDMKDVSFQATAALARIGVNIEPAVVMQMMTGMGLIGAMDANFVAPVTPSTISTPVQFLQAWLPGFVHSITAARKIDQLIGISTVGAFHDAEVVQPMLEFKGAASPYGDYASIPLSSWNPSWERRSIVRFEQGLQVGMLEEARSAAMNVSSAASKRIAASQSLEITRNRVGFLGYNGGVNRTYGLLNDPSLPAYVSSTTGVGGNTWNLKTFKEICADIRVAMATIRTQSQDVIDPSTQATTMILPTNKIDFLSVMNDLGSQSVAQWLKETYPKCRVESAPEFVGANGGADVMYLFADRVEGSGDDDGQTFTQMVPTKFMALGVEKRVKSYLEAFANATAGVLLKRPYAVFRMTGI